MAKDLKIITSYKGELRLSKDFTEDGKVLETKTNNMVDLADYLVKNDLVELVLDASFAEWDLVPDAKKEGKDALKFDAILQKMKDDPSLIVSPLAGAVNEKVDVKEINDVSEDEDMAKIDKELDNG